MTPDDAGPGPLLVTGGTGLAGSTVALLAARQGRQVRALVRGKIPHLDDDRHFHPDIALAIGLVRSGAVIAAAGGEALPSVQFQNI